MFKGKVHDLQALELWLKDMLKEDVFEPTAYIDDSKRRRQDLEMRAQLSHACIVPLLDHVERHSPKLHRILKKVFISQEKLVYEAIGSYRKQLESTESLAEKMETLVSFSERQLRRSKHKADYQLDKAVESKEGLDAVNVSMKILKSEHDAVKKHLQELEGVLGEVRERTESDVRWASEAEPGAVLGRAVEKLDVEKKRKLKMIADMDLLMDQFEIDHITAMKNQNFKAVAASQEVQIQTKEGADEPTDVLIDLARARGIVSSGSLSGTGVEPPLVVPRRWRAGWKIPFGLRCQMTNHQLNKRAVPRASLLKLILMIYQFKLNGHGDKPGESAARSSSNNSKKSGTAAHIALVNSLYEASYHHLRETYGLGKLSDWHVTELVNSCQVHADHTRVALFGYLIGVFDSFMGHSCADLSETESHASATPKHEKGKKDKIFLEFDSNDKHCAAFILEALERIAEAGEFYIPSSGADSVHISKNVALSVVNHLAEGWRISNAGTLTSDILQMSEVAVAAAHPSSNESSKGLGRRQSKAAISSTTAATEAPQGSKDEPIAKVDLDEVLSMLAQNWLIHEREWRGRLTSIFVKHCTLMRFTYGTVIACKSFESDLAEKRAKLFSKRTRREGFFGVLTCGGFRATLKSLSQTANKRQIASHFGRMTNDMVQSRAIRSDAVWLKVASTREGDKGRSYYVNQLTNERVWDERPTFDTELDEVMSANEGEEVDLETFVAYAIKNRWYGLEA